MKVGCPNHPRRDLLEEIRWIGVNGFDFVDLFVEPDRALPEKVDPGTLKDLLEEHRLGTVGHTAWYLPLGSPFGALREKAVEIVCGYLPFFQALDCPCMTVHANWASGLFSEEECVDFRVSSLERILRETERFGIQLMYEPLDTPRDTLENLVHILSRLPELAVHIDIGHAHVQGIRVGEFFERFPGKVAHIHLHDNDGSSDQHLPPGAGLIDWAEVLSDIRRFYDGTITLEVFSRDRDYLLLSKTKLEQYWKKAGQGLSA